jgi:hypothetical protein
MAKFERVQPATLSRTVADSRSGQWLDRVRKLDAAIDAVHKAIDELVTQLGPVIVHPDLTDREPPPPQEIEQAMSPLAREIESLTETALAAASRLEMLINQVEL